MPRYFFDIRDDLGLILDEEGIEFSDRVLAEFEGYLSASDLANAALFSGRRLAGDTVEITDENGVILSEIKVEMPYRYLC
jgi:hypothetical protein